MCVGEEDEEGLWLQAGLCWLPACEGLSWVGVTVLPRPANTIGTQLQAAGWSVELQQWIYHYYRICGFGYTGFVPAGEEAGQHCTLPPVKSAAGSALIPAENPLSDTYVNAPTSSTGKKYTIYSCSWWL